MFSEQSLQKYWIGQNMGFIKPNPIQEGQSKLEIQYNYIPPPTEEFLFWLSSTWLIYSSFTNFPITGGQVLHNNKRNSNTDF